jgi:hypothetical protein
MPGSGSWQQYIAFNSSLRRNLEALGLKTDVVSLSSGYVPGGRGAGPIIDIDLDKPEQYSDEELFRHYKRLIGQDSR